MTMYIILPNLAERSDVVIDGPIYFFSPEVMIDSGIGIGMDFVTDDGIGKVFCGNDNHISNLRYL